ncbi:UNVERIFIED_ORG: hypothetical protein J2X79_000221 [Arthrobacter globiformis]|nr:hypothetical protein [Arthrobacter globiformis]
MRGTFVARAPKSQYELLLEKSGGKIKNIRSQPFQEDLRVFRTFGAADQQAFITSLKHRKAILEKDWFIPGITLIVVAATALVLSSTSMLPYALQWRTEVQDLLKKADALGIDKVDVSPNASIDFYTTTLLLTAGFIATFAALLVHWNYGRVWRLATTSVWIEALEAEVIAGKPAKRERVAGSSRSVPARWRAKTTKAKSENGRP